MPAPSTKDEAARRMVSHSWQLGAGFVVHGAEDPLPKGALKKSCSPPPGTRDRSRHLLKPPGGKPLMFTWIDAEGAWARWGGRRLAFTAQHLGAHGWTYVGPAKDSDEVPAA